MLKVVEVFFIQIYFVIEFGDLKGSFCLGSDQRFNFLNDIETFRMLH